MARAAARAAAHQVGLRIFSSMGGGPRCDVLPNVRRRHDSGPSPILSVRVVERLEVSSESERRVVAASRYRCEFDGTERVDVLIAETTSRVRAREAAAASEARQRMSRRLPIRAGLSAVAPDGAAPTSPTDDKPAAEGDKFDNDDEKPSAPRPAP